MVYTNIGLCTGRRIPAPLLYDYRGKNFLKCSLVLRTSTLKSLLVLLTNNAGHSRKYNLALYFFYLSVGHWMKIYACPE